MNEPTVLPPSVRTKDEEPSPTSNDRLWDAINDRLLPPAAKLAWVKRAAVSAMIEDHHQLAVEKNWYTPEEEADIFDTVWKKLLLVVGEISEATEELRAGRGFDEIYEGPKGKPEGFLVELADAVIRINDIVGLLERLGHLKNNPAFGAVIDQKHAFNATRPARHGGKKA